MHTIRLCSPIVIIPYIHYFSGDSDMSVVIEFHTCNWFFPTSTLHLYMTAK